MILAAGLTPTWQHIYRFDRLAPGEVNRALEVLGCASGKAINVGSALATLGVEALSLAPLGGGHGRAIADEFAARGIAAAWTACAAPTRVCTTLLEVGVSTELVENAAALSEEELAAFVASYRAAVGSARAAVLTGSLPPGTPATFYRDLLRATPCPAVLDARGPELLAALDARPRAVKPNREELARTVGHALDSEAALWTAMRDLVAGGAGAVVVTAGPGAVLVLDGAERWHLTPPAVRPVVNPIGCGDCLAAGMAWGLAEGLPLVEAVARGVACAADNLTWLLPARLHPRRVADWQQEVAVRPLDAGE